MKKSTTYPFILAVVAATFAALLSAGFVVSAQNSNSSTTMTNSNTNTTRPRRPRRPRAKPTPTPETSTEMTAPAAETPMASAPRHRGGCDPSQQEQTDLSGTYNGKVKHGDEAAMDATLTITGNNFTMTAGSETHSGRISAVTTCGYTAVTVMMGDMTPPSPTTAPAPNKAMSLRAKRVGNSLTLMSVPGEPEKVMFTTGGGSMRPRRHRPHRMAAPAATPTPPQQ